MPVVASVFALPVRPVVVDVVESHPERAVARLGPLVSAAAVRSELAVAARDAESPARSAAGLDVGRPGQPVVVDVVEPHSDRAVARLGPLVSAAAVLPELVAAARGVESPARSAAEPDAVLLALVGRAAVECFAAPPGLPALVDAFGRPVARPVW